MHKIQSFPFIQESEDLRIQGSSPISDVGTNSFRFVSKEWYLCMMHKIQPFHGVLTGIQGSKDPVKFKTDVQTLIDLCQ